MAEDACTFCAIPENLNITMFHKPRISLAFAVIYISFERRQERWEANGQWEAQNPSLSHKQSTSSLGMGNNFWWYTPSKLAEFAVIISLKRMELLAPEVLGDPYLIIPIPTDSHKGILYSTVRAVWGMFSTNIGAFQSSSLIVSCSSGPPPLRTFQCSYCCPEDWGGSWRRQEWGNTRPSHVEVFYQTDMPLNRESVSDWTHLLQLTDRADCTDAIINKTSEQKREQTNNSKFKDT